MTTRELPRVEWAKLEGTELWPFVNQNPDAVLSVLVVEDGDQIVGCWGLVTLLHAEGVWIREDKRGTTGVARRLLSAMRKHLRMLGMKGVMTGARPDDARVQSILDGLHAERLPYIQYFWPMEESCPQ